MQDRETRCFQALLTNRDKGFTFAFGEAITIVRGEDQESTGSSIGAQAVEKPYPVNGQHVQGQPQGFKRLPCALSSELWLCRETLPPGCAL